MRLQTFLRKEFERLAYGIDVDIYYTVGEHCYHINTDVLRLEYTCYHHEADTKIFYHAEILRRNRSDMVLTIDSGDTDVICIAAYFAHTTEIPVYLYRKGQLFNCKQLRSSEVAEIIIPFHAFTGADTVTGFFGHSKKTILSKNW